MLYAVHFFTAGFFAVVVAASMATQSFANPAERPNFILIMADDLGYGDIGCYGGEPTPNLDALAANGIRLTDYHSNGAVCSPTRAALVTGRYQQRSGISGVVTAANHRHTGLATEETTFAEIFQQNGYATALIGKWHLGYAPRFNPIHHGFQLFRGYVSGNVDFFSHIDQAGEEDWWHQTERINEDGYTTHLITQHAIDFVRDHKDAPFCLYIAHEAPHYPYQGPNDPAIRRKGKVGKTQGERKDIANVYREMITEMDKGVGQLVSELETLKIKDNTLVIFCSDNGATQNGSNGNLRGFKGQIWEGGHRVPAIASWPGRIAEGTTLNATVLSMDWFPTMLAAADIPLPGQPKLDGVNLLPVLTGAGQLEERTVFWSVAKGMAARQGRWKLVVQPAKIVPSEGSKDASASILFDLENDPSETTPVDDARVMERLRDSLEDWQATWASVKPRT
jgi:arylsulfatase A